MGDALALPISLPYRIRQAGRPQNAWRGVCGQHVAWCWLLCYARLASSTPSHLFLSPAQFVLSDTLIGNYLHHPAIFFTLWEAPGLSMGEEWWQQPFPCPPSATPERYSRKIQPKDTAERYSRKTQPKDTAERYSRKIQPKDTAERHSRKIQPKDTAERYSRKIQPKDTAERYSRKTQPKDTAERHSRKIQPKDTAERYSRKIQPKDTAERHSRKIQPKDTAERYSRKIQHWASGLLLGAPAWACCWLCTQPAGA